MFLFLILLHIFNAKLRFLVLRLSHFFDLLLPDFIVFIIQNGGEIISFLSGHIIDKAGALKCPGVEVVGSGALFGGDVVRVGSKARKSSHCRLLGLLPRLLAHSSKALILAFGLGRSQPIRLLEESVLRRRTRKILHLAQGILTPLQY